MKMLITNVFAIFFVVVTLTSCGGGSSSPPNSAPSEVLLAPGTITGKVVADQTSGLFKTSFAVSPDQTPVAGALCSLADNPSLSSATDQDGIFRLVNVSLGLHLVVCTKTDSSGNKFAVLQAVEVAEGKGSDLGFIALRKTGHIRGRVNVTGLGDLIGIDVFIPGTSFIAKTDSAGGFTLNDVPDGTHTLRAQKDVHRFRDVPNIQVVSGQTTDVGLIEINFSNRTASITSTPPTQNTVLTNWSYNVVALDPDEDQLTLSVATGPSEMTVTGMTVSWTPSCVQIGTIPVTLSVEDAFGGIITQSFTVTVVNPNDGAVPENPCPAVTFFEGTGNPRSMSVDIDNIYMTVSGDGSAVIAMPLDLTNTSRKCLSSNDQFKPLSGVNCFVDTLLRPSPWVNTFLVMPSGLFWGGAGSCDGWRSFPCTSPGFQTAPLDLTSVTTMTDFDIATSVVSDGAFFYWTAGAGMGCGPCPSPYIFNRGGTINKIPIAGEAKTILVDMISPDGQEGGVSFGMVVDSSHVYWTERRQQVSGNNFIKHPQGDALKRASKVDGSGLMTLVTGLNEPWSLKIKDGVLYWAEMEGRSLKKVDASCIAPCIPTTLVLSGKRIIDLEVDDVYVYWIEEGPNGTINRVLQTGGIPEIIAASEFPTDIIQDSTYIYWAEVQNVSGPPPFKIRRAIK